MMKVIEMIEKQSLEQFNRSYMTLNNVERDIVHEEHLKVCVKLVSEKVLDAIDKMKAHPTEKQLNKEMFKKEFGEREDTGEAFAYLIRYIKLTWSIQFNKEQRKIRTKNKKVLKEVARYVQELTGADYFSFY